MSSKSDTRSFAADVKAKGGLTDPFIWTYEDKILDGRHRYRACHELGIPCMLKPYEGTDPAGFVLLNLHRRHLTDDQRATLVAKIRGPQWEAQAQERMEASLRKGVARSSLESIRTERGKVTEKIAAEAKVSEHKARQAVTAVKAGFADDVIANKTSLKKAAAKAPGKPRKTKPKKAKSFEEQGWAKFDKFIKGKWPPDQRNRAKELVHSFLSEYC